MIDIALIREKPDWVKAQIGKLQDEPAVARIDTIVALDQKRRALLTESESMQAHRKTLNAAMGRFRGDKNTSAATKAQAAQAAAEAIVAKDYPRALDLLSGPPSVENSDVDSEKALAQLSCRGFGASGEAFEDGVIGLDGVSVVLLAVGDFANVELRGASEIVHRVEVNHVLEFPGGDFIMSGVVIAYSGLKGVGERRGLGG